MEKLDGIVFYALDKAIKSYRQFAQQRIKESGFKITIDQWLVIKTLLENPTITQKDLSSNVFKDEASVTRIISNLVRDGYINRNEDIKDRRKSILKVTAKGVKIIQDVQVIVDQNRADALAGLSQQQIEQLNVVLKSIIANTAK